MFKSLLSSYVFGSDAVTPSSINTSSPNGLSKMKFNKHCVVLIGVISPKNVSVENVANIFINICPEFARYCVIFNRFLERVFVCLVCRVWRFQVLFDVVGFQKRKTSIMLV